MSIEKKAAKDVDLFRNASVYLFYSLKALTALEQVITSVVNKKNKVNEQNFDGEANWSGVVNFHCMQMSLVVSMRFIFNDDWKVLKYPDEYSTVDKVRIEKLLARKSCFV